MKLNRVGLTNLCASRAVAPGCRRDLEDSFMSSGGQTDRRTSPPNPNTDCLHPAAAQTASPGSGGQLTKHLLTAHTASAQLKLRFSKQDAAAWEGENSTSVLLSELFLKNTSLVKIMSLGMTESYLYMGNNAEGLTGLDLNDVRVPPELAATGDKHKRYQLQSIYN